MRALVPDGNLWFVEQGGNYVGRITTSGTITEFLIPTGNCHPIGITKVPDGNLWFTEFFEDKIGRITTGARSLSLPSPMATMPPLASQRVLTATSGSRNLM